MPASGPELILLAPGDPFPDVSRAWSPDSEAPGLLAMGASLDADTLARAYAQGIFPWFSPGQPILWWSPDPRMVLQVSQFRLHRSLRKTLLHFLATPGCEIRFDSAFARVIRHCAEAPRGGQNGTWIVPAMVRAYEQLHDQGLAHSVETWVDGRLVGGLYCVALGRAVFGESMFALQTDASKLALAALVGFCRSAGVTHIDCQQNTPHLASLGAQEMPRSEFMEMLARQQKMPAAQWCFEPLYFQHILSA